MAHMIGINSPLLPLDAELSFMNLLPTEDHGAALVLMDGISVFPSTIADYAITLCPKHGCIGSPAWPNYSVNTAKYRASSGRSISRDCWINGHDTKGNDTGEKTMRTYYLDTQ
jgi:hypothetical protein